MIHINNRHPLAATFLLTIVILLLSIAALSSGQDLARCTYYKQTPSDIYLGFPESDFVDGTIDYYSDDYCVVPGGEWDVPADGWAYSMTEEEAVEVCDAALSGTQQRR